MSSPTVTPVSEALRRYNSAVGNQSFTTPPQALDLSQSRAGKLLVHMVNACDPKDIDQDLFDFALMNNMHPSVLALLVEKSGPTPLLSSLKYLGRVCTTVYSINNVGKILEQVATLHPSPTTKVVGKIAKMFKKTYKTKIDVSDFSKYQMQKKMLSDQFVLGSTVLISSLTNAPQKSKRSKM